TEMTAVHWDPQSLEIRSLAAERLVTQVTTLVNTIGKGPSIKKRGHSKKVHVLAASVEEAAENFLEKEEKILVAAVEYVRKQGDLMKTAAGEFTDDPCSSVKQGNMVQALKVVEDDILKLRNYKALKPEVNKLNIMAVKRPQELKDVGDRDQMAAARGILQKNVLILYIASQHPDVAACKANRDLIYKQLQVAQATASDDASHHQGGGGVELAYVLNNFDKQIIVGPLSFSKECFRPSLEEHLEGIISGAALMGDSSCTHDDRHERIVAECNTVLQYMGNAGCKERSDAPNSAIDKMTKKTRDMRKQLHKAVMDHVSDSFLETNVPLLLQRMEMRNKEYARIFCEHGNKLIEVANLACSISNNEEGVKLVRMSASQLEALCPQVVNAALDLAKPQSRLAQENMDLFKRTMGKTSPESHFGKWNKCIIKDVDGLGCTAGAIQGWAAWAIHIVTSEMDNYEPGVYTEKVLEATKLLSNTLMPRFTEQAEAAMEALSSDPAHASHLVYGGIWDMKKAVLMIRTPEDLDDSYFEMEDFNVRSRMSIQTKDNQLIAGQSVQAIMAQLPQEQKAKIAEQVASFQEEKSKLDAEVSKWDNNKRPLKNTLDVISASKKIAEAGSRMDKLGRTIADHCPDSACNLLRLGLLAYLHCIAFYCHQLNICSKVKAEV
uniref:Catenin (cadherin-associated protein), alpha 1 n=1 Tax=Nomascus leucogenys TaxID=61853 RepID=A0A2I3G9L9_NOMLE